MSLSTNTTIYKAIMRKVESGQPLNEDERRFLAAYRRRDIETVVEDTVDDFFGWMGF